MCGYRLLLSRGCLNHDTTYFRTFLRTFESTLCRGSNIRVKAIGRYPDQYVNQIESPSNFPREPDKDEWTVLVEDLADTTFSVPDLTPNKAYEFRVIAQNDYGCSEPCTPVRVPERAGPPRPVETAPAYNVREPEKVDVTWQPAVNEENYEDAPISYIVQAR